MIRLRLGELYVLRFNHSAGYCGYRTLLGSFRPLNYFRYSRSTGVMRVPLVAPGPVVGSWVVLDGTFRAAASGRFQDEATKGSVSFALEEGELRMYCHDLTGMRQRYVTLEIAPIDVSELP